MPLTRSLERPPAAASGVPPCLQVEIKPGAPAVAEVSGEIDIATASWLRETLLLGIRRHGPVIRVDLRRVTFIDCSGINALIATARRASLEGGQMQVTRPSAQAWRLIMLLSLQGVLTREEQPLAGESGKLARVIPWRDQRAPAPR